MEVGKLSPSVISYYSFVSHVFLQIVNRLIFEPITYYHTFAGGTLQLLQRCVALNAMQIPHELIPMFITLTGTREFEREVMPVLALKTLLESTEGASGSFEA